MNKLFLKLFIFYLVVEVTIAFAMLIHSDLNNTAEELKRLCSTGGAKDCAELTNMQKTQWVVHSINL